MIRFLLCMVVSAIMFTPIEQLGADPTLNPANGHYYDVIAGSINWFDARAEAETLTFMGLQGYLATITSAGENEFIVTNLSLSGSAWVGGFQPPGSPEPDGNWQWVTGEPFEYTNWASGEPNDAGNEDYLHIYGYGIWNDEPGTWTQSCYVVEYSQLPSPTITGTTPSTRGQGAIGQDIVITGTGFPYGVTASFSGNDITVNSTTLVSSTELIVNIDIASDASVEVRDIIITSPYTQTKTGESIFSVNAAPTLLSIDPSSLLQGSENWDVSIMGSGFVDNLSDDPNGPQLAAAFGSNVTVNSVTFVSSTQLMVNITIARHALGGVRDVTVINGNAGVTVGAGLFTVVPSDDDTPPAAVENLSASSGMTGGTIELHWTAPGDDGNDGTAHVYIIRYNTVPIAESNWAESFDVDGEPTPAPAGTWESMTVTVPYPGVTYYFAIKTKDDVSNVSDISNSPHAKPVTVRLYAGWNLVALIAPAMMTVEDAISSIRWKYRSVWRYDASGAVWLRHFADAPDFLNNLRYMGSGYGYWIHIKEDCNWDFGGIAVPAPANLAMRRPPFLLYGRVIDRTPAAGNDIEISLESGSIKADSYVMGSNPDYGHHYVLEVPVYGSFCEGDAAQLYVNEVRVEGNTIALGGMGTVRRHDIYYIGIPKVTKLLQNYPNSFNPDTWIPYQLNEDSDVTIRIYISTGQLVRTLSLGFKQTGFYTSKDKSAYWNGKNEAGEYVASGAYFYTIQAGEFTDTKKMLIAK